MYSANLDLQGNWMVRNRGPSGYGLGLKDVREVRVEGNVIGENREGIFMEQASGLFRANLIAGNDIGLHLFPSAVGNRLVDNTLLDNGEQVLIGGLAERRNHWAGNYWSDYRGFDADADGMGDRPYQSMRLFERLTDRAPMFRLFAGSLAAHALDTAAAILPVFAPRPKVTDPTPRMRPLWPGGA
jgi:nitrous oxidase accessory protein